MIDKEKIEKGLRCCIEGDHCNSVECPYYDAAPNIQGCTQALCQDVLVLLKEQEGVVRCKDCRRNHMCAVQSKFAYPDDEENWFCAYGKRR